MICPTCGFDNLPGNDVCSHCHQDMTTFDRPTAGSKVERSLMEDQVCVLNVPAPTTVLPETTVGQAIAIMLEKDIGAVLVVDEQGQLAGIFSERDLLKKIAGLIEDFTSLPVSRFMTARPETVPPSATLDFVLHKMDGGGYRHVPVLDQGKPMGVVSVRDMLRHITRVCQE